MNFEAEKVRETKKSVTWTYSEKLHKLFVKPEQPCPILFKTQTIPPPESYIDVKAAYIKPEHMMDPVTTCPNHAKKEGIYIVHIVFRSY